MSKKETCMKNFVRRSQDSSNESISQMMARLATIPLGCRTTLGVRGGGVTGGPEWDKKKREPA